MWRFAGSERFDRTGRRPLRLTGRRSLPALTIGAAALSVAGARLSRRLEKRGSGALPEHLLVGTAATAGTTAIAIAEWLVPMDRDWPGRKQGRRTDLAYLLISGPPTAALAATAASVGGRSLARRLEASFGRTPWPSRWPLPARIGLALVLSELVHYWHHRASHDVGLLWRFHSVHHSATHMTWTNSLRFHPLDHLTLLSSQSMVLIALGIDRESLVGYSIFKGIHGQIQHANLPAGSGVLGWVLSTAEQHRWHHAAIGTDGSVNHGAVLSLWDRVFGTFHDSPGGALPDLMGLWDRTEYPEGFAAQLLEPFRRSTSASRH